MQSETDGAQSRSHTHVGTWFMTWHVLSVGHPSYESHGSAHVPVRATHVGSPEVHPSCDAHVRSHVRTHTGSPEHPLCDAHVLSHIRLTHVGSHPSCDAHVRSHVRTHVGSPAHPLCDAHVLSHPDVRAMHARLDAQSESRTQPGTTLLPVHSSSPRSFRRSPYAQTHTASCRRTSHRLAKSHRVRTHGSTHLRTVHRSDCAQSSCVSHVACGSGGGGR